jgi:hypothetical protein
MRDISAEGGTDPFCSLLLLLLPPLPGEMPRFRNVLGSEEGEKDLLRKKKKNSCDTEFKLSVCLIDYLKYIF